MFKALDLWLPAYLRRQKLGSERGVMPGTRHVLLCVCDHFEPFHHAQKSEALARVARWREAFPQLAGEFRDSDGAPPKHTFFYPIEQFDDDIIAELAALCRETFCETEIHLHHERDTAENLRTTLERGKENLRRHGLLSRDLRDSREANSSAAGDASDSANDSIRYGFIHGNWALDDSHPQGLRCGVRNELRVLRETGCYADFTMPSAPDPTQTRTINSLYYATDTSAPKSHDTGVPAQVKQPPSGDLLLVQGPLGLNWRWRRFGILPRIENGDLTAANPPTLDRFRLWCEMGVHVRGRPQWLFVKLHTHGAISPNIDMLLGEKMRAFHRDLARFFSENKSMHLHYVTAREMVNILHAAEDGHSGDPGQFRDHRYRSLIERK